MIDKSLKRLVEMLNAGRIAPDQIDIIKLRKFVEDVYMNGYEDGVTAFVDIQRPPLTDIDPGDQDKAIDAKTYAFFDEPLDFDDVTEPMWESLAGTIIKRSA